MKKTISLVLVLAVVPAAEVAKADFTFGTPTNLGPTVNSSSNDGCANISADGLELYLHSTRSGGSGQDDLWVATRATKSDGWSAPVNLGPTLNSSSQEWFSSISADGLSLFFSSNRPGGRGNFDIWVSTRATTNDPWEEPVNLGLPVNTSSAGEQGPSLSADGLKLFLSGWRAFGYGGRDIWVTTRATTDDDWGTPVNLGPTVNSSAHDGGASISTNGLALFFHSGRSPTSGDYDLWVTTRPTKDDDWGTPANLGPKVNSSTWDESANISTDGSVLYFSSTRAGGYGGLDIWQVSITRVLDFNGDGKVDSLDMCIMIDHWHTDEPLYDIGPMPWGDGIVDFRDLVVLTEYWLTDFRLMAHWKLDETEGTTAHDTVDGYDGFVGGPVWQPTGGKVDGALEFAGAYDLVSTLFVLDPAEGAYSAFAWIKGGQPGQVIISQADGTGTGQTWLGADTSDGRLMTTLTDGSALTEPLVSEYAITDGEWHHIGVVWNGSHRHLYVDGAEVAKDTDALDCLEASDGGLYFGVGKDFDATSCFAGLIDDIRIYNVALSAEEIDELAR